MKKIMKRSFFAVNLPAYLAFFALLSLAASCRKIDVKKLKNYEQVNLVANNGNYGAANIDPLQINSWGLAWAPSGIAWVNSQGGHVSALYNGEGVAPRKPVNIPSPAGPATGNPTGIVFNGSADFVISNGQAARFLFVNLDGVLSGWNGAAGDNAILIKDNSATSVYTGMAIGVSNGANYIYASDFRAGKIVVWDKSFNPVDMSFKDPWLPKGYSPFNIQAVGEWLYVLYAKVGPDGRDEKGVGKGVVSIFKTDGSFVKRFATGDLLNAPWGITQAHKGFFEDPEEDESGKPGNGYKNDHHRDTTLILVGNFGDGKINAYTTHGEFVGQLRSHGRTITIDGLWAIGFAPATATAIDPNRLYFTAGPAGETDGLFGYLIKK
jgi:uncharacterized protein (TIGR03118 family)